MFIRQQPVVVVHFVSGSVRAQDHPVGGRHAEEVENMMSLVPRVIPPLEVARAGDGPVSSVLKTKIAEIELGVVPDAVGVHGDARIPLRHGRFVGAERRGC